VGRSHEAIVVEEECRHRRPKVPLDRGTEFMKCLQLIAPRLRTTDRLPASITDHFRPHALTDAANAIGVPSATRWRRNRQGGAGLALQRFVL
jgi:hypothetical protein